VHYECFPRLASPLITSWWFNALKVWEMWMAVPQVIAMRIARFASAGIFPGARDRKEFALMRQEKLAAFSESASAMTTQFYRMNQEIALNGIRQWWSIWTKPWLALGSHAPRKRVIAPPLLPSPAAVARVAEKGLAPIHRRATRNARRLGKLRKR
jgi:hypothetical protein